jgi:hypothetical protein
MIMINKLATAPAGAARGKSESQQMAVLFGASWPATVIPQMYEDRPVYLISLSEIT